MAPSNTENGNSEYDAAINAARGALDTLDKASIQELKAFPKPHQTVVGVC